MTGHGTESVVLLSPALAVLASVANGLASVLQRKAARIHPTSENLSWRLTWHLMHQPVWFAGVLAVIAGFLLQAAALGAGRISVVEPVLVLELPATLILASLVFRSRMTFREWGAAAAMTTGLAVVLYSLSPSGGSSVAVPPLTWAIAVGINVTIVALAVAWATTHPPGARRAAILGAATGCAFGLTAALIKGVTNRYEEGFTAVLSSWQLYGMVLAGLGSLFLLQSALNAGRLLATQPGLTLVDPVVAVVWGVLVFGEHVRAGVFLLPALVGAAVVVGAVIALGGSPLLSGASGRLEDPGAPSRRPPGDRPA
ncbi:hypothetical protein N566_13630 [Streptomycetaceae bacterium MP113-05]|nr:hypothetical protein N566_13630 [Streptomycetaceae bacterium MP113-05]